MKLQNEQAITLFRVKKQGKSETEPFELTPGVNDFQEMPNPTGGSAGQPWLVLQSDPLIGMAKPALLRKLGVSVLE